MAGGHPTVTRLPLFPLPDLVCFPRTEMKLLVEEPRYLRMVKDLMNHEDDARWIGMVLVVPSEEANDILDRIQALGERAYRIGQIEVRSPDDPPLALGPLAG